MNSTVFVLQYQNRTVGVSREQCITYQVRCLCRSPRAVHTPWLTSNFAWGFDRARAPGYPCGRANPFQIAARHPYGGNCPCGELP